MNIVPIDKDTLDSIHGDVSIIKDRLDLIKDRLSDLSPIMSNKALTPALLSVILERKRQDEKWGEQNHDPTVWIGILGEEFGEFCQAVNETWFDNGPEERAKGGYENMRKEAIQVAAVAISIVECLDRRFGGSNNGKVV